MLRYFVWPTLNGQAQANGHIAPLAQAVVTAFDVAQARHDLIKHLGLVGVVALGKLLGPIPKGYRLLAGGWFWARGVRNGLLKMCPHK
ncbi:MAG: hypothetical protein HC853_11055 [Anaerolineae bacterium]|nr:hypothetical protein [Anaerolineae bacterium]